MKFHWFTTVIVSYRIIVSYRKKNLPWNHPRMILSFTFFIANVVDVVLYISKLKNSDRLDEIYLSTTVVQEFWNFRWSVGFSYFLVRVRKSFELAFDEKIAIISRILKVYIKKKLDKLTFVIGNVVINVNNSLKSCHNHHRNGTILHCEKATRKGWNLQIKGQTVHISIQFDDKSLKWENKLQYNFCIRI